MKRVLLVCMSVLLLSLSTCGIAQTTKMAVFSLPEVLKNDAQTKEAQENIRKQFVPEGKKIVTAKKTLKTDVETFNGLKDKKSEKAKQLIAKIKQERDALLKMQTDFNQKFSKAQQENLKVTLSRVKEAVAKVAYSKRFNLVLTKRDVAYNDEAIDITKQVSQELKRIKG
jgi:Skp family chaperone for outer membrane proteins